MRTILVVTATLLAGAVLTPVGGQAPARPSLSEFDDAVAQGRRVMRRYCAITQEVMAGRKGDTSQSQQQADALEALRETRVRWAAVQKDYAEHPPAEYARDKDFAGRLQDIADAMEEMERALTAGQARRSFRACGFACGLFVAMHEDNGLEYPLDKLFHLRKEIKSTQALLAAQGVRAVRGRMVGLLARRDAVVAAPAHSASGIAGRDEYGQAVRDLSRALDDLAFAAAGEDASRVEQELAGCAQLANKAYGLAL
jgi:hypothetical protein